MATVQSTTQPLIAGDKLSLAEFLERWEDSPHIKFAELIGGIVYMPSPLGRDHANFDSHVSGLLYNYRVQTLGCETGLNASWLMEDDSPQPDSYMCILPEYGGQFTMEGSLFRGAPEFVSEVCVSSTSYDLNQKLELYQRAGVQEYLAVLVHEQEMRLHTLQDGVYQTTTTSTDILRSAVFPGLWINTAALLANDGAALMATLNDGLASAEHAEFVEMLSRKRHE